MRIAAITHVRHDDFFLDLWVRHYGGLIGREHCYVLLDGEDWQSGVDLCGVNVIPVPRTARDGHRIKVDRRMALRQGALMEELFAQRGYDYIFKGDCDEYIVPDPLSGASIQDVVREADKVGVVYSSGIDVLHNSALEPALDARRDVMCQRHYGLLSQGYFKVNLVGRLAHERGVQIGAGGHRADVSFPVHVSARYYMLHLGWCDLPRWQARFDQRVMDDRKDSFRNYFNARGALFDRIARSRVFLAFEPSMASARKELCFRDGQRVHSIKPFRRGNFPFGKGQDYLVRLDERFHNVIASG